MTNLTSLYRLYKKNGGENMKIGVPTAFYLLGITCEYATSKIEKLIDILPEKLEDGDGVK